MLGVEKWPPFPCPLLGLGGAPSNHWHCINISFVRCSGMQGSPGQRLQQRNKPHPFPTGPVKESWLTLLPAHRPPCLTASVSESVGSSPAQVSATHLSLAVSSCMLQPWGTGTCWWLHPVYPGVGHQVCWEVQSAPRPPETYSGGAKHQPGQQQLLYAHTPVG